MRATRRVAVIGCGRGELAIAWAIAGPTNVIAGFDPSPDDVAAARHAAAQADVADRVTFEVASRGWLLGDGYDVVYLLHASDRHHQEPLNPD